MWESVHMCITTSVRVIVSNTLSEDQNTRKYTSK